MRLDSYDLAGYGPEDRQVEGRGPKMEPISPAAMSVRELITQLSEVEADLRRWRHPGPKSSSEPAVAELVHHEQVIVRELRRRRARSQHLGSRSSPTRRSR